jgi:hypothetical protein
VGFFKHRRLCCVLGLFLRHHLRCIIKWIFPQFLRMQMQICIRLNSRAQRRVITEASSSRHRRRW